MRRLQNVRIRASTRMRADAAEERAQSERRRGGKLRRLQNVRNQSVEEDES